VNRSRRNCGSAEERVILTRTPFRVEPDPAGAGMHYIDYDPSVLRFFEVGSPTGIAELQHHLHSRDDDHH
jgi:hypothetical protein